MSTDTTTKDQKTAEVSESTLNDLLSDCIGLHKDRLDSKFSKLERDFVEKWREWNDSKSMISVGVLENLFRVHCDEKDPDCLDRFSPIGFYKYSELGEITERDMIVAETLIQWLGTNVGQGFLHELGFHR